MRTTKHISPPAKAGAGFKGSRDPRVIPMYRDSLTLGYHLSPLRGSLRRLNYVDSSLTYRH